MPIPRFKDADGSYEVFLMCACGWCITKDKLTKGWKECRMCGKPLRTTRVDYDPPYGTTYADGKPPFSYTGQKVDVQ
jgi:hypothetical protein